MNGLNFSIINTVVKNIINKLNDFALNSQFLKQFIKYSIVGVFNTLIGLGIIFVLFNIYKINYILANVIGYSLGLINSFLWNKRWTFRSLNHYSKEIIPFIFIFIVSYFANLIGLIISVEVFMINHNLSFILGSIIYVAISFTANRKWTFSNNK